MAWLGSRWLVSVPKRQYHSHLCHFFAPTGEKAVVPVFDFFSDQGLVRPELTAEDAESIVTSLFGITGTARELGSQQDRNFRIDASVGGEVRRYVLKVDNPAFSVSELAAQNAALEYLSGQGMRVPSPVRGLDGNIGQQWRAQGAPLAVPLAGSDTATKRSNLELDDVPELIADYMTDRTHRTHGRLAFVAEFMAEEKQTKFTEMGAVRMAYESWVDRNGNGAVQQSRLATRAMIRKWDEWPDTTRSCSNPIEAFRSLAEFEAEFEDFERRVQELAFAVDGEINFRIDYAKGK